MKNLLVTAIAIDVFLTIATILEFFGIKVDGMLPAVVAFGVGHVILHMIPTGLVLARRHTCPLPHNSLRAFA